MKNFGKMPLFIVLCLIISIILNNLVGCTELKNDTSQTTDNTTQTYLTTDVTTITETTTLSATSNSITNISSQTTNTQQEQTQKQSDNTNVTNNTIETTDINTSQESATQIITTQVESALVTTTEPQSAEDSTYDSTTLTTSTINPLKLEDAGINLNNIKLKENEDIYATVTNFPTGNFRIRTVDLSSSNIYDIYNSTTKTNIYVNNLIKELLEKDFIKYSAENQPLVLIVHTHTTESYATTGATYLPNNFEFRSTDPTKNVVAVGQVLAAVLESYGIKVIHDKTIHDDPYTSAYTNSYKTVDQYLKEYPSIKYIFDLHRDALGLPEDSSKSGTKPLTIINGYKSAQVMLYIGTDDNGTYYDWQNNLHFALMIQKVLISDNLMRKIYLANRSYNAELGSNSILLEIGSAANTLDEAKYAAFLLGHTLAQTIINSTIL